MKPVVVMDSHNPSSDNCTSEIPNCDYYSYENSDNNDDTNNAKNTIQLLTTVDYRTEGKNNNNNKKKKSNNHITSSILARILIVGDEPDMQRSSRI